jgi:pseudouridine-5'-phosphate glycosidase
MQKFFQSRRRRALAVAAPLALVASVAFAAWITDGIGPGHRGRYRKLGVTDRVAMVARAHRLGLLI